MTDLTPQASAITFRWLREVPARDEVIRIDAEGFHYLGQFIADAGEAYQLLVEFLRKQRQAPVPVAWMYQGEPDFDGKKWRENWLVTLDRRLAEHGVRLGLLIPLFRAQIAPTPVPVSERLPGPVSDRQQQIEDLAADAVSALRYIEQSHGRLYGIGWDRVYEKADRLLPAHALPLPEVGNG